MAKVKVILSTMDGEVLDTIVLVDVKANTQPNANILAHKIVNTLEHNYETEEA